MRAGSLGCLLMVMIVAILIVLPDIAIAQEDDRIGKISVVKSAIYVGDSKVQVTLQISNVGKVRVSQISIIEYFNPAFIVASIATVKSPGRSYDVFLTGGPAGPVVQAIVELDPEISLAPGERADLQYEISTSKSGDFLIPTALVSYSYTLGRSLVGTNIYSNGVLVHISDPLERFVQSIVPYVVSSSSGVVIFTVIYRIYKYRKEQLRKSVLRAE